MDEKTLSGFVEWFLSYAESYRSTDPAQEENRSMKLSHTLRVRDTIRHIASGLGLSPDDLRIAECVALFHDVGRFEQAARYGSFSDADTVDHGALGAEVLKSSGVLDALDPQTRGLVLFGVACHNRACLPLDAPPRHLFFTGMVRDADKLDIWAVVTDFFTGRGTLPPGALEGRITNAPKISGAVLDALLAQRTASIRDVQTLNDLKLLQLGWIYDLNHKPSFALAKEKGYLDKLRSTLPSSEKVEHACLLALAHLEDRLR